MFSCFSSNEDLLSDHCDSKGGHFAHFGHSDLKRGDPFTMSAINKAKSGE